MKPMRKGKQMQPSREIMLLWNQSAESWKPLAWLSTGNSQKSRKELRESSAGTRKETITLPSRNQLYVKTGIQNWLIGEMIFSLFMDYVRANRVLRRKCWCPPDGTQTSKDSCWKNSSRWNPAFRPSPVSPVGSGDAPKDCRGSQNRHKWL